MSVGKLLYGTTNQTFPITLNSLADAGGSAPFQGRGSNVVDNATNLFLDALVFLQILTGVSGVGTTGYVEVYAYGSSDGGSTYTDAVSGTDAATTTIPDPPNMRLAGILAANTNSGTFRGGPFAVAAAFGGVLPQRWGIVVRNRTGAALASSSNSAFYQGVQLQVV